MKRLKMLWHIVMQVTGFTLVCSEFRTFCFWVRRQLSPKLTPSYITITETVFESAFVTDRLSAWGSPSCDL